MSISRLLGSLLAALLVAACGTVEENAWTSGVDPKDATEISQAIRASTPVKIIYGYSPDKETGGLIVFTDDGTYSAQRVKGKWKFHKEIVVT
jgi:16S rRNA U516 pseudouridylate synthase RsuA-like enzyme